MTPCSSLQVEPTGVGTSPVNSQMRCTVHARRRNHHRSSWANRRAEDRSTTHWADMAPMADRRPDETLRGRCWAVSAVRTLETMMAVAVCVRSGTSQEQAECRGQSQHDCPLPSLCLDARHHSSSFAFARILLFAPLTSPCLQAHPVPIPRRMPEVRVVVGVREFLPVWRAGEQRGIVARMTTGVSQSDGASTGEIEFPLCKLGASHLRIDVVLSSAPPHQTIGYIEASPLPAFDQKLAPVHYFHLVDGTPSIPPWPLEKPM